MLVELGWGEKRRCGPDVGALVAGLLVGAAPKGIDAW